MATQTVGIEEFQDNLASFLEGHQTLAITRRGEMIGLFLPVHKPVDFDDSDLVEREVDELVASWGATEEELMAEIEEIRRERRKNAVHGS